MLVLGKAIDMSVKVRGGDFPLGALPMKIQRIVREANDCYGYPVDYLAGAMLVAVGLGIGNTHFARLKGKWDESAILFMALVGRPGALSSRWWGLSRTVFSTSLHRAAARQTVLSTACCSSCPTIRTNSRGATKSRLST